MAEAVLEVTSRKPPTVIRIPKKMMVDYRLPLNIQIKKQMRLPKEVADWIMRHPVHNKHFRIHEVIEATTVKPVSPKITATIEPYEGDKINLNAAGRRELKTIPFLTPAMINAILAYRKDKPFTDVADLVQVPGISEHTMRQLAQALYVEQKE